MGPNVLVMSRPPRMLTTREAARGIGIAGSTLAKYVREGKIKPTIRLPSGHLRWDLDDLKAQVRGMDPPERDD